MRSWWRSRSSLRFSRRLGTQPPHPSPASITLGVFAGGTRGAISGPFYFFRAAWERATGAKLNIVEIPFDQLDSKIKTDLITKAGRFDGFVPCGFVYGD